MTGGKPGQATASGAGTALYICLDNVGDDSRGEMRIADHACGQEEISTHAGIRDPARHDRAAVQSVLHRPDCSQAKQIIVRRDQRKVHALSGGSPKPIYELTLWQRKLLGDQQISWARGASCRGAVANSEVSCALLA
jgi:hypothetical protein